MNNKYNKGFLLTEKMRLPVKKIYNYLTRILLCNSRVVLFSTRHFFGIPRRYPKFPVEILAAAFQAKNAIAFFGLICCAVYLISNSALAQVEQQTVGEAKKAEGGYNFFDIKTKEKTGSSRKVREDIYYYDKHGNLVGKAKKDRRNKSVYNYYNADGVRIGILRQRRDGSYSFMDNQSGKIVQTRPSKRGDVGSLSLETIRGKQ